MTKKNEFMKNKSGPVEICSRRKITFAAIELKTSGSLRFTADGCKACRTLFGI